MPVPYQNSLQSITIRNNCYTINFQIEINNETVKTGQNDLHVHTLTFTSLKSGNEGRYTCVVTFQDDEMKQLETEVYSIGGTSSLLVMFNDLTLLTMTTDLPSYSCPFLGFHSQSIVYSLTYHYSSVVQYLHVVDNVKLYLLRCLFHF